MKFTELTVTTTSAAQELVADVMWNYTNYGVAISDEEDLRELIENRRETWDYIDDKLYKKLGEEVALVKAYIPCEKEDEILPHVRADLEGLKAACAGDTPLGSLETIKRVVDGDEWIDIWKKHYRPIDLGKVVVCPAWIKHEPKKGQVKVLIDSNTAFGTGEHETTSMVLEMMQDLAPKAETALDVGTGSGILGIAAALLGAKKVIMTDIDFVAVKSAEHNAEINGVLKKCEIFSGDFPKGREIKADLAFANITADVLLIIADDLTERVARGGTLIMSGIIKKKADEVEKEYFKRGFQPVGRKDKGEWVALSMKKV